MEWSDYESRWALASAAAMIGIEMRSRPGLGLWHACCGTGALCGRTIVDLVEDAVALAPLHPMSIAFVRWCSTCADQLALRLEAQSARDVASSPVLLM
jgi:hypothetical protein